MNSRLTRFGSAFLVILLFATATVSFGQQQTLDRPQPDDDYETAPSSVPQPPAPKYDGPVARGRVFVDKDGDGKYSETDSLYLGAKISNGIQIVKSDSDGMYELPIAEGQTVFLIKPAGFRTSLSSLNLPQFYYTHKPNGSPKLKFAGSKPTGKLPRSIDFPLYEQQEPDGFKILLFGDPQPRDATEVDYMTEDIVADLVGSTAAFGVTLGDIVFDDLEVFKPMTQSVALIGIPWYNVIGNHDLNLDAQNRDQSNETFEATFGPTYYSFDYGQVHFVVLDNIDWELAGPNRKKNGFMTNFGEAQREWLKKDLSMIPKSQMVVLLMHVPVMASKDAKDLYRLIEDRPLCISISGHTHFHEHRFINEKQGWKGKEPHHHIINVTVSGSWWSGQKDERGIPHTTMADGAPNGYSILSFDGDQYKMDFRAAGGSADDQMRITMQRKIESSQSEQTEVYVNVFNGSEKSKLEIKLNGELPLEVKKRTDVADPYYVRMWQAEQKLQPPLKRGLTKPKMSSHLWSAKLPADLPPGTHVINVKTTDMHGRTFTGRRLFRVTGKSMDAEEGK